MKTEIVGSRHLSLKDAALVHGVLLEIQKAGENITAQTLLDYSRPQTSPTHHLLPWDDKEAAEQHRLTICANLIREVHIEFQEGKLSRKRVRAYVNVNSDNGRHYLDTIRVLSKKELREQMLSEALKALEQFQRKYATLRELSSAFEAIDKATRRKKSAA
jgi:hypothetical protein